MIAMALPSERYGRGDPRPIGFTSEPSPSRVSRTIGVLEEVAAAATMPGEPTLSVCLTSVVLPAGLPFNLQAFALQEVDDDGRVTTDAARDEVLYAIVANQAVDLQREIAITSLFQLLGRQALVSAAMADSASLADLPARASTVDEERTERAGSQLRGDWRAAIQSLHAEAGAAGVVLGVRYAPDPFPDAEAVRRRYPALRRAYDELNVARDAIDRAVGVLATAPWKIVGGDEHQRRIVQEQVEAMQLSHFVAQGTRDGYALGDGYVLFGGEAERIRALRPERVLLRDDRMFEQTPGGDKDVTEGMVHIQGMTQLRSPYGVSLLELALNALRAHDHAVMLTEEAGRLRRRGLTINELHELQAQEDAAASVRADATGRLETLFAFFREQLPTPRTRLYFPGQERLS
jgi:hypothetical protein